MVASCTAYQSSIHPKNGNLNIYTCIFNRSLNIWKSSLLLFLKFSVFNLNVFNLEAIEGACNEPLHCNNCVAST